MQFEAFLRRLRAESNDQDLLYWADLIFLMHWNPSPLVEKRFMGGPLIWFVWALRTLLCSKRRPCVQTKNLGREAGRDGFRLLSTPAHLDTLRAVLVERGSSNCQVYGNQPVGGEGEVSPIGLASSIGLLNRYERLSALLQAIRIWRKVRRLLCKVAIGSYRPRRDFSARMIEQIFSCRIEMARFEKAEPPLRALFLTYELGPESKAITKWARRNGSRVIHIMHGQRLPTYQVTKATDLVLFSKLDEAWFRERVDPNVRIWCVGHPRLEMLREKVGSVPASDGCRMPRISFFSQPSEGDYDRDLRRRDWRILCGLKGRAEVRFRLHPREPKQDALDDLKALGLGFVKLSEEGLAEDLIWCDAVASSWSTASMEAAACGRGVFWTCSSPENYEASQELRDAGLGVLINHAAEWDSHLDAWRDAGWSSPVVLSEARLRELGMIGDMDRSWHERLGLEGR